MNMKNKLLWLTQTALFLALLIALQALTKAGGQFVTGSCVNAVLALSTLLCGWLSGGVIALVSPFMAFLLGIGPAYFPIVPAIALGNLVFVLLLHLLSRSGAFRKRCLGALAASAVKAGLLYLVIVVILCPLLSVPEKQAAVFSTMFSWPQLVTALLGSAVALAIHPLLKKALQR